MDEEINKLVEYLNQNSKVVARIEKESGQVMVKVTLYETFTQQEFDDITTSISNHGYSKYTKQSTDSFNDIPKAS